MFSQRLIFALGLSSFLVMAMASVVNFAEIPTSQLNAGAGGLTIRQTDDCPGESDCDCTDWGADCDVSDWSWIDCTSFPDACAPPPPTPGPITCATGDQQLYKKCWQDIHAKSVDDCAAQMYVQLPNGNMTSESHNITQVYREGGGKKGVTYSEFWFQSSDHQLEPKSCVGFLLTINFAK